MIQGAWRKHQKINLTLFELDYKDGELRIKQRRRADKYGFSFLVKLLELIWFWKSMFILNKSNLKQFDGLMGIHCIGRINEDKTVFNRLRSPFY
ncbi:hypothetical protein CYQ88_08765 [Hydrogenovibrio sp. SC-1]|nr:hypothetical protein CYQ88_08765 [Hydrogenovibrio sp. SC-1]